VAAARNHAQSADQNERRPGGTSPLNSVPVLGQRDHAAAFAVISARPLRKPANDSDSYP